MSNCKACFQPTERKNLSEIKQHSSQRRATWIGFIPQSCQIISKWDWLQLVFLSFMAFTWTLAEEQVILRKTCSFQKKEGKRESAKREVQHSRRRSQWSREEHVLMWKSWSKTDVSLLRQREGEAECIGRPAGQMQLLKLWQWFKILQSNDWQFGRLVAPSHTCELTARRQEARPEGSPASSLHWRYCFFPCNFLKYLLAYLIEF